MSTGDQSEALNASSNWSGRFAHRTTLTRRSAIRELLKLTTQPDMISFAGGLPCADLFPMQAIRDAANTVLKKVGPSSLQYSESEGLAPLRDWIAARFSQNGLNIKRNNVIIFSGAQQALDLVGRIFLDSGDKVLVENPTYLALLSAWRPLGAQFVPMPADQHGIQVGNLEPLLQTGAKLLYTIPTFQNPSGTTLSIERRHSLVKMLREHKIAVVEDDPYRDLRYEGTALTSLLECDVKCFPAKTAYSTQGAATLESNVIHISTFSKVLAPGLRIGWVVASEEVIEKLVQVRQAADLHTNTFSQHVVLQIVQDGVLDRQIPLLISAYRERRDTMLAAMEKYFPKNVTWTRPEGGMFLMVNLPDQVNAADILREALKVKVAFVPGEDFHTDGTGKNTLRLNFSNATPSLIEEGIRRLGIVLKTSV